MNFDIIIVRYGELYTKGKNKKVFINQLFYNIKFRLSKYLDQIILIKQFDRIFIELNDRNISAEVVALLKTIFGIHSLSLAIKTTRDIDDVKQVCLDLVKSLSPKTFKLEASRSDKSYHLTSTEIKQAVAPFVLKQSDVKVDVHSPELTINIEVRHDKIMVFQERIMCLGGMPVGVSGLGLVMLSGGIDSPVASFLTLKRGMSVDFIHFITPPHTSEEALNKVKQLIGQIGHYSNQQKLRLHIVNFSKMQLELMHITDPTYRITIMRRMFYRIAQTICHQVHAKAIITGESLGQVASQTIESINTINDVVSIPVLRPVICFDKLEIIALAKQIGTYEISIQPFEDCCSLFVPKNPVTKPNVVHAQQMERDIMWQEVMQIMLDEEITTCEIETSVA